VREERYDIEERALLIDAVRIVYIFSGSGMQYFAPQHDSFFRADETVYPISTDATEKRVGRAAVSFLTTSWQDLNLRPSPPATLHTHGNRVL
jgi:hypothetical protein